MPLCKSACQIKAVYYSGKASVSLIATKYFPNFRNELSLSLVFRVSLKYFRNLREVNQIDFKLGSLMVLVWVTCSVMYPPNFAVAPPHHLGLHLRE